jgi:hypothetical protein
MTSTFDLLIQLPGAAKLLEIARSDNPLIALGVAKREVSWTRFLGWLLDPLRHPKRGELFVRALIENAQAQIAANKAKCLCDSLGRLESLGDRFEPQLVKVVAEAADSAAGRADLLVECLLDETPLAILVENKIRAKEQDKQLAGYVEAQRNKSVAAIILPILIQLGDCPVQSCTCPWAVVWDRGGVVEWFRRAVESCVTENIPVPALVNHYLQLFEAWDIARHLREQYRQLIEEVERSSGNPAEWQLLSEWLWQGDQLFFDEVQATYTIRDLMKQFGLLGETSGSVLGRNELLQLWKPDWVVEVSSGSPEKVGVHFEARARGRLQVDVEIDPYEGSLKKKPERLAQLKRHIALKGAINQAIRDTFSADKTLAERLGANQKRLSNPDDPATCGAVRFDRPQVSTKCSVDECAAFYAEILSEVTPIIDAVIVRFQADSVDARPIVR